MNVLVACEESQVITVAFRMRGHKAFSCDLQDCSGGYPEWHIKGDVMEIINNDWDLLIGHPPCTYLSYAGTAHWNAPGRLRKRLKALEFFGKLYEANIPKICLENPKGCASPTIAKYDQEIQPYFFGDSDMKTTWLWLKGLPPLVWQDADDLFGSKTSVPKPLPTFIDKNGKNRYFTDSISGQSPTTSLKRSKTFPGIAAAMAEQWG